MKNTLLISLLLFVNIQSYACCEGFAVNFYPSGKSIATNTIILLDYTEDDYKVFKALEKSNFYLEDETGKKIELEIAFKVKGHNNLGQFLFTPKEELSHNSTVKFKIDNFDTESRHKDSFLEKVNKIQWNVTYKKDTIQPLFTAFPKIKYYHSFNSTVPGHAGYGKVTYTDNVDYYWKDYKKFNDTEILAKVINEVGQTYYIPLIGKYFSIHDNSCGGNFKLEFNKTYQYSFQLMDLSGNFSDDIHKVEFFTDENSIEGKGFPY